MIERSDLVEMFERMAHDGVDPTQELLWGYFFIDSDPERLERAARELEAAGYRLVEMFEDEDEGGSWMLHVERVESHDVSSLDARNQALDRFARERGLDCYDGMDVGRVDGKPFPKRGD